MGNGHVLNATPRDELVVEEVVNAFGWIASRDDVTDE